MVSFACGVPLPVVRESTMFSWASVAGKPSWQVSSMQQEAIPSTPSGLQVAHLLPIYTPAAAPATGSSVPATFTLGTMLDGLILNTLPLWQIETRLCPSLNHFTLYVTTVLQAMPWFRRLHFTSRFERCFEADVYNPSSDPETAPSARHHPP